MQISEFTFRNEKPLLFIKISSPLVNFVKIMMRQIWIYLSITQT